MLNDIMRKVLQMLSISVSIVASLVSYYIGIEKERSLQAFFLGIAIWLVSISIFTIAKTYNEENSKRCSLQKKCTFLINLVSLALILPFGVVLPFLGNIRCVDGIWLSPIYASPMEDNGYDDEMVPQVSSYIISILDALDYLHSRGIIHRDIKPSNIMMENGDTPKLMDLGIARVTGSNLYTSMGFVGTPLYASPEQILRDKTQEQATAASDIYSLGMTLYVLINGSNPFNADTESKILKNQVTKKLPVSERLKKRKWKKLMNVIWKATEKDKENRYQTAIEFKIAIQNALNDRSFDWKYLLLIGSIVIILIVLLLIIIFCDTHSTSS